MWWPFFLAFGLLVFWLAWRASDRRGEWVAGIWCLGIILMQLPVVAPFYWLYGASLWTVAALVIGLMVGAARVGLIVAAIPVGYWALYFNATGHLPLGWGEFVAFGITEFAGVLAVSIGAGKGIRHGWSGLFGSHASSVGRRDPVAVDAKPGRTDSR